MVPPPRAEDSSAPGWQAPMLATSVAAAGWSRADRSGWVLERKLDGLRCLGVRRGGEVMLWSRNHNSFLERFPEVAAASVVLGSGWSIGTQVPLGASDGPADRPSPAVGDGHHTPRTSPLPSPGVENVR